MFCLFFFCSLFETADELGVYQLVLMRPGFEGNNPLQENALALKLALVDAKAEGNAS